jgi:hypothetical protein
MDSSFWYFFLDWYHWFGTLGYVVTHTFLLRLARLGASLDVPFFGTRQGVVVLRDGDARVLAAL